ncbi:MAG: hypothetical protein US89_C0004G0120 [Candidatus Peregrinibacteria bacterium GW2011_GWF2_38_29]|nr:MAG: hypothetical protein US89_C0004G0120 [Candidatus Peregrinibacteria bacterium GW2011_GWF2_38_29]HBB02379.1 hypothetical protein [Candidatus Peregrinibacteria bacterium]
MNVKNTLVAGAAILAGFGACGSDKTQMSPAERAAICEKCNKGRDATHNSALNAVNRAGVMPAGGDMSQRFVDTTAEIDRLTCLRTAGLPADACSK